VTLTIGADGDVTVARNGLLLRGLILPSLCCMENIGSFNGQLACLIAKITPIPKIGSGNESTAGFTQFQPARGQSMFACEFLKGWPQTHLVRKTHSSTADMQTFSLAMARRHKECEYDTKRSVRTLLGSSATPP
jgi:hypothetical protein